MQDRRCHQVRSDYRRRGIDCVLFLCLKSTCSLSSAAAYRRREIPQHSSQTPQVWPSPSFFRCTRGHWTACGVCRGSVVSNCYLTALYTDITDLPTPQFKGLDTLQKEKRFVYAPSCLHSHTLLSRPIWTIHSPLLLHRLSPANLSPIPSAAPSTRSKGKRKAEHQQGLEPYKRVRK